MSTDNGTGEVSLRERVLGDVTELILSGELGPGMRLHERNLSKELGVSRVPLREAILTLAAQGLVEVQPRVGAFVRPLTGKYVEDLFEVRHALEPLAASLAALHRTPEQIAELARLVDDEQRALAAGDSKQGSLANAEFHLVILRASGNELIYATIAPLQAQIQRLFRRTIVAIADDLFDDHVATLDAIIRQDADEAAAIARRHLDATWALSIALAD